MWGLKLERFKCFWGIQKKKIFQKQKLSNWTHERKNWSNIVNFNNSRWAIQIDLRIVKNIVSKWITQRFVNN